MNTGIKKICTFLCAAVLAFAALIVPGTFGSEEIKASAVLYGEVSYSGSDSLYGYTSNYVCYGGAQEAQHRVYDGWHISAYSTYYSHGVTWYECWDTDDGDYYGWIDSNYLYFYSGNGYKESVPSYSINPRRAEVDGNGVYGYTSNYVLCGGSQQTQHKVQDGWHITAYNTATAHGVTWYECWDTDDGDYYGWIDSNYIAFYDEMPPAQKVVTVTVTVPVTVTVTQMVTVAVTETMTQTEASQAATTETFRAEIVMAEDDDDSSGINGQILIIIIAAIVVIIIAAAAVLIALISRKPRYVERPVKTAGSGSWQSAPQHDEAVFCMNCGTQKPGPNVAFCPRCGQSFRRRQ